MKRQEIVERASNEWEKFVKVVQATLPSNEERRWLKHSITRGRERLRFAPRDGEVPADVAPFITDWFQVLDAWQSDGADLSDTEALQFWVDEWPRTLVDNLLFQGHRSPEGIEQTLYEMKPLIPPDWTIDIFLMRDKVRISAGVEDDRIEFDRFLGLDDSLSQSLRLGLDSLAAAVKAHCRDPQDIYWRGFTTGDPWRSLPEEACE